MQTSAGASKAMYTSAADVYMHLLAQKRHTYFDEAKFEYKGGGGWLVCIL